MPGLPPAPRGDHWFFDCWSSARDGLIAAGVPGDQVFVAELCTASHPGAFCSYRRDGSSAGRMAAAIRKVKT
jgi:copper oxidase (laccase) domain-containing protein